MNEGPQKDRNELALWMIELNKMLANAKILQKRKDPKAKIYIKMIQQDLKDAEKKMAKLKSVKEADLGLTHKKGKTVKVRHKKSGKSIVIIDKPNVRKEYEKLGFYAESVNENSAEKAKIVKLLIKYGNNPKEVKPWVNKHYKKAKGDRSGATPAQLAQYISFLTANESVKEGVNEAKNIKLSKDGYVKQVHHPMTNKILKSVKVNGKVYRYNSTYKTYNSVKGNELLYKSDVDNIRYESVNEAERDYKAEYKKYGSSTKAKKYRAELNQYNRKKGTYGNGDGKDASHKGGKIVGFEKESVNRGRAEKSRLKKEANMPDFNPMIDKALDEVIEEYTMSRKGVIDKIATLAKANKYGNVDGTQMNGKTAKQIIAIYNHPKMKRFKKAMADYTVDQFVDLTIKLPKVLGIKEGIMDEGQKRRASDILRKFDMAYIKFSQEVRDVMKLMDKSTGNKTDSRIINKAYGKHLIPFDDIMQSWARGQQNNPKIDESVKEDLMNENPAAIAAAQRMVVQNKMGKKISVATAKNTSYAKSDPKAHKKAKSIWDRIKARFSKKEGVNEGTTQMFSSSKIDKAIKIAKSMGGNMTGAVKKIEKIEKNLSKNGRVEYALQQANESINEAKKMRFDKDGNRIIPKRTWLRMPDYAKMKKNGKDYVLSIDPKNKKRSVYLPAVIESVNEAAMELNKIKDAILMFQKKIKKQGRITNARDADHLKKLIKLYRQMGGKGVNEKVIKVSKKDDVPGNAMKMSGEEKIKKLTYSGSNGTGSYEIKGKNLNVNGIRPRDKGFFVRHFTMKTGFRKANLYYDGVSWMDKNKKF